MSTSVPCNLRLPLLLLLTVELPAQTRPSSCTADFDRWMKEPSNWGRSDASSDVKPSHVEGISQPVHTLTIMAMGTPIFDNCDLERLSMEARKRKRWDFLLTTLPLTVAGATGSPLELDRCLLRE